MKHIKLFEEFLNEATPSEIIKDLDKVRHDLIKKVDVLIAKKKKLYSNIDIESPMSADEKELEKDIQSIFSQIQQIIQQKRKLKESVNDRIECDNTEVVIESYVLRDLEDKYGIDLDLYDNGKFLELSRIVIPKEKRSEGLGSEIMKQINDYADSKGLKIYLTPSKDFGATSTSRLEKFYKDHGFVKNTDKSETRNTMVRLPQ